MAAVYTVPSSTTAVVLGVSLANKDTSSRTADVLIVSDTGSNADSYLGKGLPLPVGGTLEIMGGNKLVLQTTDVIQAKASAGSAIDVIVSIMEIT